MPAALSSPPRLSHRNLCSCLGWDRAHTAGSALAAGIAVELVIVKSVLVVAVTMWMYGADVVIERESIGMVDWRKVRVKVQRRKRKCRMFLRTPWSPKWVLNGLLCRFECG